MFQAQRFEQVKFQVAHVAAVMTHRLGFLPISFAMSEPNADAGL
jgi:hypothetical protein